MLAEHGLRLQVFDAWHPPGVRGEAQIVPLPRVARDTGILHFLIYSCKGLSCFIQAAFLFLGPTDKFD